MTDPLQTQSESSEWVEVAPKVNPKILAAEARLNAPLRTLLRRWVLEEQQSMRAIANKLDIGYETALKFIIFYGLHDSLVSNAKLNKALRNYPVK